MTDHLHALPPRHQWAGNYRMERVLGSGGLVDEKDRPQSVEALAGGGPRPRSRGALMLSLPLVCAAVACVAGGPSVDEARSWRNVDCQSAAHARAAQAHLVKYPQGVHAGEARECLAEAKRNAETKLKADAEAQRIEQVLGREVHPFAKDDNGWTDLHYAAALNFPALAARLLDAGTNVDARLNDDSGPLSDELKKRLKALGKRRTSNRFKGGTPLHIAAWSNAHEVAVLLLGRGADASAKNNNGSTPLHWVARNNAHEVAVLLLGRGADASARNKEGRTPLHAAAWSNAREVALLLLDRGADVNAKSNYGSTPLDVARRRQDSSAEYDELVRLLERAAGSE